MMSVFNPPLNLNQAHQHDLNAEDYQARGLLVLAAEEHYKAAEAFQGCIEQSNDENTKRTLRKLYTDHSRAGKDLQRRIAKLKEEGKDPALPHLPPSTSRAQSSTHGVESGKNTSPIPLPRHRMSDSPSNTVDESFMLLAQQAEHADDPFDIFWKVTAEMMDNLSQPIAFPAAALAALETFESSASSNHIGDAGKEPQSHILSNSKTPFDAHNQEDIVDDEEYDSSDSFYLVSSTSQGTSSAAKLRKENDALKMQMETMQRQVSSVRRQMTLRMEQDQQLRDHIIHARKEAQRAMAASTSMPHRSGQSMLDLGALNLNGPPLPIPTLGRDRESQLLRRIRELEEELRVVRTDNDKQKVMITKFRERWERLKESAKRKRNAKMAVQAGGAAFRERIDEDPDAEEAAEAQSRHES